MTELIYIVQSMSQWVYTIMTAYTIPYINVTPWTLSMSILFFTLLIRLYDKITHNHHTQDDNNNYVYKE